jgi:hypothetical protein
MRTNYISSGDEAIKVDTERLYREKQAFEVLQFWVDAVNSSGWDSDGNKFDYKKMHDCLDDLEVMMLIYNIFADTKLELEDKDDLHTYALRPICRCA